MNLFRKDQAKWTTEERVAFTQLISKLVEKNVRKKGSSISPLGLSVGRYKAFLAGPYRIEMDFVYGSWIEVGISKNKQELFFGSLYYGYDAGETEAELAELKRHMDVIRDSFFN